MDLVPGRSAYDTTILMGLKLDHYSYEWAMDYCDSGNVVVTASVIAELLGFCEYRPTVILSHAAQAALNDLPVMLIEKVPFESGNFALLGLVTEEIIGTQLIKAAAAVVDIVVEAAIAGSEFFYTDRDIFHEVDEDQLNTLLSKHDLGPLKIIS